MLVGGMHMKNSPIFSTRKRSDSNHGPDSRGLLLMLLALVFVSAVMSMCLGAVRVSFRDILTILAGRQSGTAAAHILLLARLPRTCGCLLAGMALAVSGAIIQSVLNNPLAAPNVIGVNSGAGLMVILFSAIAPASISLVPFAAFAGALLGVMLVLVIGEKTGASRITLVLSGVAVSNIFSAGIDAVITFVPDALNGYSDFRIGGFANLSMSRIVPAFWLILIALILVLSLSHELDILNLGADTAQSLGLPARKLRLLFLVLAAALAGAAVSFSGLLGFVGLIIPHIMRKLVGEENHILIPACALGGAALVTICDLLARIVVAPYELPVGIVLSLLGGPFFLWLLLRQRGGRTHD